MRSLFRRLLVLPIDLYSLMISPLLIGHYGPACRFDPPCSAYARAAILRDGFLRGLQLALGRLLRCRPGGAYGFDPLPPARSGHA
ncbi:MAG TPA: membrane protein insertion efficiency factor YidD [Candidatus Binataceae bacterium]|nr:membrane protein insertion efficiency factor YidD [Candidatus Binataceae bacterium]